jgi:hypothetical protein
MQLLLQVVVQVTLAKLPRVTEVAQVVQVVLLLVMCRQYQQLQLAQVVQLHKHAEEIAHIPIFILMVGMVQKTALMLAQ